MTQYLILHKVRGEPSFDIAVKARFGDEDGWVLSTCGHRAYPYKHWQMEAPEAVPADWPDHYQAEVPKQRISPSIINSILNSVVKIKRRI